MWVQHLPIMLNSQKLKTITLFFESASVAKLDARQTSDQEVAGLLLAKLGNILLWRLIMKYFLWSFSPFC